MTEPEFNPMAGVLAWLWPGLGHISLGQRRRGGFIMFGVLFLFLGGLLIGGIDCVDRQRDFLWFLAQAVCGPIAFAADWINQNAIQSLASAQPDRYYRFIALNKPNEMGTLFSALAGLMNLVVILDAMFYVPKTEVAPASTPERRRASDTGSTSQEYR